MCFKSLEVELEEVFQRRRVFGSFFSVAFYSTSPLHGVKAIGEDEAMSSPAVPAWNYSARDWSTESFVDDLSTCRGVVLSRAATILRSIET